jgi:hypothetical protein
VDFLVLSLPEASFLYLGLAVQALLRTSSLRHLPWILVFVGTIRLLIQARRGRGGYLDVAIYIFLSAALVGLFWPEITPWSPLAGRTTDAAQVASYAASQDQDADVITAEDTGQVPETLRQPVLVPPGLRLLVRVVTELPLGLGRVINSQTHKTFASLMPMAWFLEVELPADALAAVGDFTHACYLPTLLEMLNGQEGRTIEDLLPFGNTPLRGQLAQHSVIPSAQNGMTWLRGPNPNNTTPCTVYLSALELQAQHWLSELKSPKGTPYLELFETELGLAPETQGALLLYREMLHAAGPGVPAPSLAAQYAKIRSGSVVGNILEGAATGGVIGRSWLGAGVGALTGLFRGVNGEWQQSLEGLTWLVKTAMFLVWYSPYILGFVNLVLLGLFPFVLLWSLMPGTQFQPLAHYILALLFTCSAPLFLALVDQAARLGSQQPPAIDGAMGTAWSAFITMGLWSASLTALGLLLIPVVAGLMYFAAFRAVGNLWRGSL